MAPLEACGEPWIHLYSRSLKNLARQLLHHSDKSASATL